MTATLRIKWLLLFASVSVCIAMPLTIVELAHHDVEASAAEIDWRGDARFSSASFSREQLLVLEFKVQQPSGREHTAYWGLYPWRGDIQHIHVSIFYDLSSRPKESKLRRLWRTIKGTFG